MYELDINVKRNPGLCEEHGLFENVGININDKVIWSGCPKCMMNEIKEENERLGRIAADYRNSKNIAVTGLPKRFKEKTIDSYVVYNKGQEMALSIVNNYVDNLSDNIKDGAGLLFYGSHGTGKTHLSSCIALAAASIGYNVTYTRSSLIIRAVKDTWNKESKKTESEVYLNFSKPDLLIIDEIGRQFGTASERMILFEVINERYEQSKPTIAVTNLDAVNLSECLGVAALDRLKEKGKSILFDWGSMRSKK